MSVTRKSAILSLGLLIWGNVSGAAELITDEVILKSFARTIRTYHYVCSASERAYFAGNEEAGLAYHVVCTSKRIYKVILTPRSALIVQPAQTESLLRGS